MRERVGLESPTGMGGAPCVRDVLFFAASCTCLVLLGLVLLKNFPHLPFIRELTSSGAALTDANKTRDVMLPWLILVLQVAVITLLSLLARRPAQGWLARSMRSSPTVESLAWLIGCGLLLLVAYKLHYAAGAVALLTLFAGAAILRQRFGPSWQAPFAAAACSSALLAFGLGQLGMTKMLAPLGGAFVFMCVAFAVLKLSDRSVRAICSAAYLAISAASVCLLPALWLPGANVSGLDGLVILLAALAAWQSIEWSRSGNSQPPYLPLAIAFSLISVPSALIGSVPPDDYHFGEFLLASRALMDGQLFTQFLTPHGLSDAAGALGAELLRSPHLSAIQVGQFFVTYVLTIAGVWILCGFVGPLTGLLIFLTSDHLTLWIPLSLFLIMLSTARLNNPILYGATLSLTAAGCILAIGGMGVATSVAAVAMSTLFLRNWNRRTMLLSVCGAVLSLALLALIHAQLLGEFDFLRTAAATNIFVYGNNYVPKPSDIWETFKLAFAVLFLGTPMVGYALICNSPRQAKRRPFTATCQILFCLAPIIALPLLLTPYAMGRLDITAPRAAIASGLTLAAMVVWLAAPRLNTVRGALSDRRVFRGQLFLCGLLFLCGIGTQGPLTQWSAFRPLPPQVQPLQAPLDPILPGLGAAQAPADRTLFLHEIAGALSRIIDPGETFLDLTNRNALYFYFGRPVPMPVVSVYNAAPDAFQQLDLASLEANPPRAALISAATIEHDGLSLPFRSFAIYDWVVRTYRPVRIGSFIYGIRRDVQPPAGLSGRGDDELTLWMEAFHRTDIQKLPSAWGRSLDLLGPHIKGKQRPLSAQLVSGALPDLDGYRPEGPVAIFDIPLPAGVDPRQEGMLRLDVACDRKNGFPSLRVMWGSAEGPLNPEHGFTFLVSFRRNLVPLDASPLWFARPASDRIRIEVLTQPECKRFTLSDLALTGRRD